MGFLFGFIFAICFSERFLCSSHSALSSKAVPSEDHTQLWPPTCIPPQKNVVEETPNFYGFSSSKMMVSEGPEGTSSPWPGLSLQPPQAEARRPRTPACNAQG